MNLSWKNFHQLQYYNGIYSSQYVQSYFLRNGSFICCCAPSDNNNNGTVLIQRISLTLDQFQSCKYKQKNAFFVSSCGIKIVFIARKWMQISYLHAITKKAQYCFKLTFSSVHQKEKINTLLLMHCIDNTLSLINQLSKTTTPLCFVAFCICFFTIVKYSDSK